MEFKDINIKPWENGFALPEQFNMVSLLLERHIENGRGNRIAIYFKDERITYQDVYRLTNQTGNALSKLGVQKGDRVLMMMHDSPDFIAVFFGAMKIGAVPVPLNILTTPADLQYFIIDSEATVLVVEEDLLSKIADLSVSQTKLKRIVVRGKSVGDHPSLGQIQSEASPALDVYPTTPTDHSYWLYTSGTTGKPKGVIHLHKDLVYAVETYGHHVLDFKPDNIVHGVPRLFFSYGLNMGLYLPFYYAAAVVLDEQRPLPENTLNNLQKYRPTMFFSVPTAYAQMLQALDEKKLQPDFSFLRYCTSAGEALPGPIYKRWVDRFKVEILDGLGSSEVSWIYISNHPGKVKIGCSGTLLKGYQVKILDDDLAEVPMGQTGDLWVTSESLAVGYWNKPEQNKETFRDGWMKTGDVVSIDEEGYFHYSGRSNDTLKVSGIWVSPLEVEATLLDHPAVAQCAVVAKRDEEDLIKPKAFIVLNKGFTPGDDLGKELQKFVKDRLAPYKYPRWVEFTAELPMTATGKIQRFKLRE
ncbi:benzoate-CoA ligase family protein [Desulforhabdus sp. TSK]|uniref:benzoate-CoA ligase family protein n=1 Tax=Desulforhabdus sp. TSK TaxID=2925014 RepID=UPI001FC805BF|nr:benzoate-CoA ligase family protein [Desulforhabdus sp. TSK]GKT08520.1 acetyl-CoA synthetase [Desulforhabdus sp. TSK]